MQGDRIDQSPPPPQRHRGREFVSEGRGGQRRETQAGGSTCAGCYNKSLWEAHWCLHCLGPAAAQQRVDALLLRAQCDLIGKNSIKVRGWPFLLIRHNNLQCAAVVPTATSSKHKIRIEIRCRRSQAFVVRSEADLNVLERGLGHESISRQRVEGLGACMVLQRVGAVGDR